MAEKGKRQDDHRKKRGVNVHAVQKNKASSRRDARTNDYQRKNESTTKKTSSKETVEQEPVVLLPTKPETKTKAEAEVKPEARTEVETKKVGKAGFDEFETMRITRLETPHESKIVTRDVEKESILNPEPIITEKEVIKETFNRPIMHQKSSVHQKPTTYQKPTAKEIKEYEIKKALATAAKLPRANSKHDRKRDFKYTNLTWTRVLLATTCAITAIFAVVYFINLTSTDMSLKVAAMQSGIEASYPSYVPRGYTLSDVTSASGKVTVRFKNGDNNFTLTEENSNWDSNALLNNYIKETYGNEYTVVREQGLTIYMGDDWGAWVNGGMLYRLSATSGSLTKKQIKTIAASL